MLEFEANQTILFTGDSITDCGCREAGGSSLGNGYVNFIASELLERYPQLNLNIINTGINGNTTRDLLARWQADCIDLKPDILSILIGINDLWRNYDPSKLNDTVSVKKYGTNYREMLTRLREVLDCQLILIEPFMFCTDNNNDMFKALHRYIDVVHELADEFNAILVPLQQMLSRDLQETPPEKWSDDMVHPETWAHEWIAKKWLQKTTQPQNHDQ